MNPCFSNVGMAKFCKDGDLVARLIFKTVAKGVDIVQTGKDPLKGFQDAAKSYMKDFNDGWEYSQTGLIGVLFAMICRILCSIRCLNNDRRLRNFHHDMSQFK